MRLLCVMSVAAILLSLAGCAGPSESSRREERAKDLNTFLADYEPSFDPSQYELPTEELKREEEILSARGDSVPLPTIAAPETVQGFRVQVMFTESIDKAERTRDSLESSLPGEWVYLIYEAPYYKVRIGNFVDRPSGNRMAERLVKLGYNDAWTVPDFIIRNLPPRVQPSPPPPSPGPQDQQDKGR